MFPVGAPRNPYMAYIFFMRQFKLVIEFSIPILTDNSSFAEFGELRMAVQRRKNGHLLHLRTVVTSRMVGVLAEK